MKMAQLFQQVIMKTKKTIIQRTLLLILPPTILLLLSIWGITSFIAKDIVQKDLNRHYMAQANAISSSISAHFKNNKEFLNVLSKNGLIINGLFDTEQRDKYIHLFFSSIIVPGVNDFDINLLDYKGRIIASKHSKERKHNHDNISNIIASPKEYIEINKDGITMAQPIYYLGKIEGFLVFKYPKKEIQRIFSLYNAGNQITVCSEPETIIYTTNKKITKSDIKKLDYLTYKSKIESLPDFELVLHHSKAESFSSVYLMQKVHFIAILLDLLALTFGIILTAILISRPLKRFVKIVKKARLEKNLKKKIKIKGAVEFIELANAFNHANQRLLEEIEQKTILEKEKSALIKNEALATLSKGIAHEINSPMQFVADNVEFSKEGVDDIKKVFIKFRETLKKQNYDMSYIDYIMEETPKALEDAIKGIWQVSDIVQSMKAFSRNGDLKKEYADINLSINNAVSVTRGEWKHIADMKLNLDKNLPKLYCNISSINQIWLNMIINSSHAIEEKNTKKGNIEITSEVVGDSIRVSIKDNGCGISNENKLKIFDPFFTTKKIGKGTGQGMTIVFEAIKEHGGSIRLKTDESGTQFFIYFPLNKGRN
jgi:signal transduction histidine kinase